jgi:hypothetical protein
MNEKKIAALENLLMSIEQKKFEMDAWKMKASLVLKAIFGANDEKVALINGLHYDFSSWALRDNSGGKQHDSIKDQAREIIEAAILELSFTESDSQIMISLEENLTGAEYKKLQHLLTKNEMQEADFSTYFSKIASSKKDLILARLMLKKKE